MFAPNSDALAAATHVSVQGALQQWLGQYIQVEAVLVDNQDSTLNVTVQYTVRSTQSREVATFQRQV